MCPHKSSCIAALIATLIAQAGCSDNADRTVTFSASPSASSFAAVQDGDGPWLVVEAASDGTYSFTPSAATYGIAVVCQDGEAAEVTVVQATVGETRSQRIGCYVDGDAIGSISGTTSGADFATTEIHVSNGYSQRPAGPYMTLVPAGEWDVFAVRGTSQGISILPDRIIRKDAVKVSAGMTTALNFDFTTEGFAPEAHAVSIQGALPTDDTSVRATLRTIPGSTFVTFDSTIVDGFHALPKSQLRGDDIHFIDVTANGRGATFTSRQVRRWAVATSDFTASLPPMPAAPVVSSDDTEPYLRMRGALPVGVEADRYDFRYVQQRGSAYAAWRTALSRGYVDATSSEYALPDLSALAGFSPGWGLTPGEPVQWAFITTASETSAANLFTMGQPADELDGVVEATTMQTGIFPR